MKATTDDWARIGGLALDPHAFRDRCILELRARVEALEAQDAREPAMTAQPEEHPDTRRLRWLMENGAVEGFSHVTQDRYELATERATAEGRSEPNADDEFSGFRLLIDLATKTDAAPAQAEQGQGAEPERGKALWERMLDAVSAATVGDGPLWPALMDAVADWLDGRLDHGTAAALLRAEAQATREGRRG